MKKIKRKDYTGQKFGHYTIIKDAEDYIDKRGHQIRQVYCLCDCGNKDLQIVKLSYLKAGSTQGCNMCKGSRISKRQIETGSHRKPPNKFEMHGDTVYLFDDNNKQLYTIIDTKWFEYFKDYHVYPHKDRNNGYYWCIKKGGKQVKIHQIICGIGADHINGNKNDNTSANLRLVTSAENARNRTVSRRSKSGYKGVFAGVVENTFMAQIRKDYKLYYLGTFNDKIKAAKEYDKACIFLFGEFACLNFPDTKYDMENYSLPYINKNDRKKYGNSGYKGVSKIKNKFQARYKGKYLGTYGDGIEAAKAYDAYLKENNIQGVLNFE